MAVISPARAAALQALVEVDHGAHADSVLHGTLLRPLHERDRALATALVMGVLRWQLLLDASLLPRLRNPNTTAPEVWIALRLGLFQMWFLERVPEHAAVAESVELARRHAGPQYAGVVNAILRRLQREALPRRDAEKAQAPWMLDRWRTHYGNSAAEAIAAAAQQEPPRTTRLSQPGAAAGQPAHLLTTARVVEGETTARLQDEGSQLVAEIAATACPAASNVWDTCAAPGGKTAVLAELLPSAQILATDISARRIRLTQKLFPEAYRDRVTFELADLTNENDRAAASSVAADLVLCDAPCSGTGTLSRNPEIRLHLSQEDLLHHSERQLAILRTAWRGVKPGGILLYSTCSLEFEENAEVVTLFLRACSDARVLPVRSTLDAMETAGRLLTTGAEMLRSHALQGDFLQTLPGTVPCDGFFVALLHKPA